MYTINNNQNIYLNFLILSIVFILFKIVLVLTLEFVIYHTFISAEQEFNMLHVSYRVKLNST